MLGRIVSRLLFVYHFIRLKLQPEAYDAYAASGMPRRGQDNRQCRQCKRRGGHSPACKVHPWAERFGRARW